MALESGSKKSLQALPDAVDGLPGAWRRVRAGCGAHLSDAPFSTIGRPGKGIESLLQKKGRSEFIAAVLEGLPEAPQYFKHNAAMNRWGRRWSTGILGLASGACGPCEADLSSITEGLPGHGSSTCGRLSRYAAGHIPGSVNIALRGRLETWTGIMVPWESTLVVVGADAEST